MTRKPTVYVVDDEETIRKSLRFLLEPLQCDVATYSSAQAFLDAYDGREPACLLLDVKMPGEGGLELQQRLTEKGYSVPVIMITGHGTVPAAVAAMRAGAVDFFEKPFDCEALLHRIREAIRHHEQAGILTRITKQLSAKEARELFHHISQRLVLGVLRHLARSANFETVQRISAHMCRPEVLQRLRSGAHLRDKLIDELCLVLGDPAVRPALDREALLTIIEESGVMKDLMAMEVCYLRIEAA